MIKNISLIAAMTTKRVIGKNNTLPWHLPADLAHFKSITSGKPIVMGRKTFASIGKPLPHRTNIIVTRNHSFEATGCVVVHSLEEALMTANHAEEIFVIGGADLFIQSLPLAHKMYLTLIDADIEGDTYFPRWDPTQWTTLSEGTHLPDEKNIYRYTFIELVRRTY